MTTIARATAAGIVEPRRPVVREIAEWRALWAAHAGPRMPAPAVDFAARMVAAVFAGERPTPGFEVEIVGSRHQGGTLLADRRGAASQGAACWRRRCWSRRFTSSSLPRARRGRAVRRCRCVRRGRRTSLHRRRDAGRDARSHRRGVLGRMSPRALAYLAGRSRARCPAGGAHEPLRALSCLAGAPRARRARRAGGRPALSGVRGADRVAVGVHGPVLGGGVTAVAWVVLWGVCLVQAYKRPRRGGCRWSAPSPQSGARRTVPLRVGLSPAPGYLRFARQPYSPPLALPQLVTCATWCRPCHAYSCSSQSSVDRTVLRVHAAAAAKSASRIDSSSITQRCAAPRAASATRRPACAPCRRARPRRLVVRLDRRVVFGQRQLEADVGVHVAVGHVVHDLTHGPSAGPIRRIELRVGQAGDRRAQSARASPRSRGSRPGACRA